MKTIRNKNTKICTIFNANDLDLGTIFLTEDNDFLQVGIGCHDIGKTFSPHSHNFIEKKATKTHELIFVIIGKLEVSIYDENQIFLQSFILNRNEGIIQFNGGHGFKVLNTNTKFLEVKNGPYFGAEIDRKRISEK